MNQAQSLKTQLTQIKRLLTSGQIEAAISKAEALENQHPRNLELMWVLARLYQESNDLTHFQSQLERIHNQCQNDVQALVQLANLYYRLKNNKKALDYINQAEELSPKDLPTLNHKSIILNETFQYNLAIDTLNKIIEFGGATSYVWSNLGLAHQNLGLFELAERYYLKAIEMAGDKDDSSYNNLILLNHYSPNSSPQKIFNLATRWERKYARKLKPVNLGDRTKLPDKKLRIGMLSDGFRTHPVGQMITQILELLPKHEIELLAYSTSLKEDPITNRIKHCVVQWRTVDHLNEQQLAEQLAKDQLDILFDLSGHMSGCRLRTMVMKPAPILVKWVGGLINTTGLSTMDYLLSDAIETPEGMDEWYTEKLIRMPHDYVCYEAPAYSHDVYSPPVTHNGYITLGCFNNPQKINTVVLEQWASIMHELPNSRLFLKSFQFNSSILVNNVTNTMAEFGITAERLIIEGPSSHSELLKAYNKIDIALDPWPYSGGLTTCEAMFMGVPVVTYPGPTFAGRHSATHLTNAGLGQLVADSWKEYAELVLNLASDIDNLSNIRQHLRNALLESPVCDAPSFARHFSNAMRAIWQRHCEGKAPAALKLDEAGQCQFADDTTPIQLQLPAEPEQVTAESGDEQSFSFNFTGLITALDHGATLPSRPYFRDFLRKGGVNYICLDPGGVVRNTQQLQDTGLFHHFPLMVLGDGSNMDLRLAVEAELSSTLPNLAEPSDIIPSIAPPALVSTTTVISNRIDDINGIDNIDWLMLDVQHHNLSILQYGQKKLANALLIEVGVCFFPSHSKQVDFSAINKFLETTGFRLLKLANIQHRNLLPEPEKHQEESETSYSQAIFIPNNETLSQLENNELNKLAFLLDSIYSAKGIAYQILKSIEIGKAHLYLKDKEIHARNKFTNDNFPLVTVICPTYNHEKFIEDAIKGFIDQKTNFKFEVIIHDDASTDNTANIIKKYQKLYPDIITPIYQKENQYSKNIKPLDICIKKAKGKYIAFCDGDDFWNDSKKLQVQYDFMEDNPKYSCCYHDAYVFNQDGVVSESKLPNEHKKDYSKQDLILNNCFILTQSIFFRKEFTAFPNEKKNSTNGDNFLITMLGLYGEGKYLENISKSAYRLHPQSIWSSKSQEEKRRMLSDTFTWIGKYHKRNNRKDVASYYFEKSKMLID